MRKPQVTRRAADIVGVVRQAGVKAPWWVTDIAYVLMTVLPPFVSSIKVMRILGLILLVSLVVSTIFFYQGFNSVWWFFAALISALIVFIVKGGHPHCAAVRPS